MLFFKLTQELKMLANEVSEAGRQNRMPERLIKDGMLQTETSPEPEAMHVEDLAALEVLTEDSILEELQVKMSRGSFQSFVGDILLVLNPSTEMDIYNDTVSEVDVFPFDERGLQSGYFPKVRFPG